MLYFALTCMNVNVYGDRIRKYKVRSYIPIVGDTIAFYPLNSYYEGNIIQAYSCFYNSESVKRDLRINLDFNLMLMDSLLHLKYQMYICV